MPNDFLSNLRLQNIFGPSVVDPSGGMMDDSSAFQNINFAPTNSIPSTPIAPPPMTPIAQPDAGGGLGDIASKMAQIYHPQHDASDRLDSMISDYPQDQKPGFLRTVLAALSALNIDPRPGGTLLAPNHQAGMAVADEPNRKALEGWKNKIGPTERAATLEKETNTNDRQMAFQTVSNQLKEEAEQHRVTKNETEAKIKQQRADIYEFKAKNPQLKLILPKGGNVQTFNPVTKETTDTGIPTGTLSETDKLALGHDYRTEENTQKGGIQKEIEGVKQSGRESIAETRGWKTSNIPDPNNPGQMIGVKINEITGDVQPIELKGQNVGTITKPGSQSNQLTQSTRTMMEGATMLRPHINDLRNQALDLDKRGLFGPVMSRIRDFAAKVGTTGTPEQVQQSLDDFGNAIQNDPRINASNDRVVGQFLSNLGLMASGAGRVHGGARGGGSIQMVNYLKSLLSSSSTVDMFQGRLDTLDDYMKGYSAGPIPTTTIKKSKIDLAIDDILSGVKK